MVGPRRERKSYTVQYLQTVWSNSGIRHKYYSCFKIKVRTNTVINEEHFLKSSVNFLLVSPIFRRILFRCCMSIPGTIFDCNCHARRRDTCRTRVCVCKERQSGHLAQGCNWNRQKNRRTWL